MPSHGVYEQERYSEMTTTGVPRQTTKVGAANPDLRCTIYTAGQL